MKDDECSSWWLHIGMCGYTAVPEDGRTCIYIVLYDSFEISVLLTFAIAFCRKCLNIFHMLWWMSWIGQQHPPLQVHDANQSVLVLLSTCKQRTSESYSVGSFSIPKMGTSCKIITFVRMIQLTMATVVNIIVIHESRDAVNCYWIFDIVAQIILLVCQRNSINELKETLLLSHTTGECDFNTNLLFTKRW